MRALNDKTEVTDNLHFYGRFVLVFSRTHEGLSFTGLISSRCYTVDF